MSIKLERSNSKTSENLLFGGIAVKLVHIWNNTGWNQVTESDQRLLAMGFVFN